MTSMNRGQTKANDIEIKMIEFYNLDAHYYTDADYLEVMHKRDFFKHDLYATPQDNESLSTDAVTAKDLFSIKRKIEQLEQQEIKQDLSNIEEIETFDETVFKIFEQLKAYNNRLSDFNKNQRDLLKDLKILEQ